MLPESKRDVSFLNSDIWPLGPIGTVLERWDASKDAIEFPAIIEALCPIWYLCSCAVWPHCGATSPLKTGAALIEKVWKGQTALEHEGRRNKMKKLGCMTQYLEWTTLCSFILHANNSMQQNMQFLCLAGIFYTDYMKVVYSSKYKIKLQILGERLFQ